MERIIGSALVVFLALLILFSVKLKEDQETRYTYEGVIQEKVYVAETNDSDITLLQSGMTLMPIIPVYSSSSEPEKYILYIQDTKLYTEQSTWLTAKEGQYVRAVSNGRNQLLTLE